MKLYHGTSASNARIILSEGVLRQPYLTSCEDQASYYAECAADENEEAQVIIELDVPAGLLSADFNAYAEPLTYFRDKWATSEKEWHTKIESGEIPYPASPGDITTAIQVTGSLLATADISVEFILNLDEIQEIIGGPEEQFHASPGF